MKTRRNALTENEIRPDRYYLRQKKIFENDGKKLIENKNKFVIVNCPACNSTAFKNIFTKYGFHFVDCLLCGTMYMNPRPTPKLLEQYYIYAENYIFWSKYIFPASEKVRLQKIVKPRVKKIIKICKKINLKSPRLLEVGPGFGTFLQELSKKKYFKKCIAVEPNPSCANECIKKGLTVIRQPIEKIKQKTNLTNVIVSFEVIEHLFSPQKFIRSCHSLLSKKGLIILTCPNVRGFDISILKDKSDIVDFEHLNYFHTNSLPILMKRCGFRILDISTPGKLDAELVRKKALLGIFNISLHPFLKHILIEEWETLGIGFQKYLTQNNLSSHMWLVAQKI